MLMFDSSAAMSPNSNVVFQNNQANSATIVGFSMNFSGTTGLGGGQTQYWRLRRHL